MGGRVTRSGPSDMGPDPMVLDSPADRKSGEAEARHITIERCDNVNICDDIYKQMRCGNTCDIT